VSTPFLLIDAQLCFGVYFIVRTPMSRCGFLNLFNLAITFGTSSPSNVQHNSTSGVLMYLAPHAPHAVAS